MIPWETLPCNKIEITKNDLTESGRTRNTEDSHELAAADITMFQDYDEFDEIERHSGRDKHC